jgi:imidazolonepropionase-like amidohydrolase
LCLATANPAALLGVDGQWGTLAAGRAADVLVFSWDDQEQVVHLQALLAGGDVVWGELPV